MIQYQEKYLLFVRRLDIPPHMVLDLVHIQREYVVNRPLQLCLKKKKTMHFTLMQLDRTFFFRLITLYIDRLMVLKTSMIYLISWKSQLTFFCSARWPQMRKLKVMWIYFSIRLWWPQMRKLKYFSIPSLMAEIECFVRKHDFNVTVNNLPRS